jgi:hypothetical protein
MLAVSAADDGAADDGAADDGAADDGQAHGAAADDGLRSAYGLRVGGCWSVPSAAGLASRRRAEPLSRSGGAGAVE